MAKKIQIICTRPGMRRMGVEHPATKVYDIGHWTDEQLQAFREDAAFVVQEIDDDAVVTRGPEFDRAVATAVEERMLAKAGEMQAAFAAAVQDAVDERTKELAAKVAALEAELAATAKPAKK